MMYKFKIDKNVDKARKWCRENFGEIPLKKPLYRKCGPRFVYDDTYFAYDDKEAQWIHRYKNKGLFKFRLVEDAMAFKLRWM